MADGGTAAVGEHAYRWLGHAAATGLVARDGRGTRDRPWRYRLPGAEWANGLPPLPDLG